MKKYKPTEEQLDKKLENEIKERFSISCMSNSKWKRLVQCITDNIDNFKRIEFKKVTDSRVGVMFIEEDTTYGFDYWDNGFEMANSLYGVLSFKEIEYFKFPKSFETESGIEKQSIEKIQVILDSIGKFALEENHDSLMLYCYK